MSLSLLPWKNLSTDSEINKFERSKNNENNTLKKIRFQRQFQLCVGRLFASMNIDYNNSLNGEVQKQNEPK